MNKLTLVALMIVALILGVVVSLKLHDTSISTSTSSNTISSTELANTVRVYDPIRTLSEFTLTAHTGNDFKARELLDHWTFMFLGYTYCPDICPTTMQGLARVYPDLQRVDSRVQVVMISADPQRDTVDVLSSYVPFFHPDFIGVTAEHAQLLPFTRELGLVYSMVAAHDSQADTSTTNDYLVNHSASIALINPRGELVAVLKPDFSVTPPVIRFEQLVDLLNLMVVK